MRERNGHVFKVVGVASEGRSWPEMRPLSSKVWAHDMAGGIDFAAETIHQVSFPHHITLGGAQIVAELPDLIRMAQELPVIHFGELLDKFLYVK